MITLATGINFVGGGNELMDSLVITTLDQSNLLDFGSDFLTNLGFKVTPLLSPDQKYATKLPGKGIKEKDPEKKTAHQRAFNYGNKKGIPEIVEFFEGFETTFVFSQWLKTATSLQGAPGNIEIEYASLGDQLKSLAQGWDRSRAEVSVEIFTKGATITNLYGACPADGEPLFSNTHITYGVDGDGDINFSNMANFSAEYAAYDAATDEPTRLQALGDARTKLMDVIRDFQEFKLSNGQKLPGFGYLDLFCSRYRKSFWAGVLTFGTPNVFKGEQVNTYDLMNTQITINVVDLLGETDRNNEIIGNNDMAWLMNKTFITKSESLLYFEQYAPIVKHSFNDEVWDSDVKMRATLTPMFLDAHYGVYALGGF